VKDQEVEITKAWTMSTSANTPFTFAHMSATTSKDEVGFIGSILQPGSSLNPVFLNVLDGAFAALLLVFIMLAFLTSGNLHVFALMFIELALWASVKWYVFIISCTIQRAHISSRFIQELRRSQEEEGNTAKKDQ
jgi:hypothetical protein